MALSGDPPFRPAGSTVGRIVFDYWPTWTPIVALHDHTDPFPPSVGFAWPPPRIIGWECLKCGAVYAPQVECCKHCGPKEAD